MMARRAWLIVCFGALCMAAPWSLRAHDGLINPGWAVGAIYPTLSHAGDAIAFSLQGAIWRAAADGSTMRQLTVEESVDIEPAWSPDGQWIAYLQTTNMQAGNLRVIRAEDGSPVPLPAEVIGRDKLHFDRAGKRILGDFQNADRAFVLAWYDLTTGQLSAPIRASTARQRHALSHDERRIATTTTLDEPGEQTGNQGPQVDLWTIDVRDGKQQLVVRFPARIYDLCWAADDRSLFVVTDLGGAHNDIWNIPLDDPLRGARKLTFGFADEDAPSVSRDGRWLLTTDNRYGATALVLTDLTSGAARWLSLTEPAFRLPAGKLELTIKDRRTGEPAAARLAVQHEGGKHHAPLGSLYRLLNRDLHFYAAGHVAYEVPAGRYRIKASHGPEFRVSRSEVEVRPGQTTVVTVDLERWIDQRSAGWYAGENHIHANYGYGHWYNSPRTMYQQCAGEDLLVCNFMVANSDGDGVFDREYFRGGPDPLSTQHTLLYWNQEFRSTIWGHMTLLNLTQVVEPVFTGFALTTHPHDHPTNAEIADRTHDQGGHVNYTHPAQNAQDPYAGPYTAKELPLDVALGKVDSIDVMGSNHVANLPLWYRLLNCGFRVPASAGTDCFLNRIPSRLPGSDRVYVKIDGEFSYGEWIKQLQAGRTFVTNGPMLEFQVEGVDVGGTLRGEAEQVVRATVRVRSLPPVNRVEIVYNGEVVSGGPVASNGHEIDLKVPLTLKTGGWLAARASGPAHADQPRGDVFAHTSPIYVDVPGHPLDTREHGEYFVRWTDRLWETVRRRNRIPSRHQVTVETQVAEARAIFLKLAGRTE